MDQVVCVTSCLARRGVVATLGDNVVLNVVLNAYGVLPSDGIGVIGSQSNHVVGYRVRRRRVEGGDGNDF